MHVRKCLSLLIQNQYQDQNRDMTEILLADTQQTINKIHRCSLCCSSFSVFHWWTEGEKCPIAKIH